MGRYLRRRRTSWPCFFTPLASCRSNPKPNRAASLHGKSARGDGSPLSRLSAADQSAPKAQHRKRTARKGSRAAGEREGQGPPRVWITRRPKKAEGIRLFRAMAFCRRQKRRQRTPLGLLCQAGSTGKGEILFGFPLLVPVTGLEPVRGCPQGILSPWCLPFHHTGVHRYFITAKIACQEKRSAARAAGAGGWGGWGLRRGLRPPGGQAHVKIKYARADKPVLKFSFIVV